MRYSASLQRDIVRAIVLPSSQHSSWRTKMVLPKDIVHLAVIEQLLKALRQWPSQVRWVKIKIHTGCLLNERSDEQVDRWRAALQILVETNPFRILWVGALSRGTSGSWYIWISWIYRDIYISMDIHYAYLDIHISIDITRYLIYRFV